jgi:DNA-binding NarL/FixJ family response regulator
VRILIADDSLLLREGLTRIVDELGHDVVATVADATAVGPAVAEHDPDLAIVDIRMPPTFTDDGLRASVELRASHPRTAVLVLSQFVEVSYADELFASGQGSVGYLLKDRVQDLDVLERAIDTVVGGGSVLDPEVVARLLSTRRADDPVDKLTPRERDVLGLMAEGRSNKAIATELIVSEGAVQKHIGNIFTKLDLLPSDGDHRRVLAVLAWLQQR